MSKHVRNSVKAVIIRDGRLLVIRKSDTSAGYYVLPGGGQHKGETLPEALIRECAEEIGAPVTVGKLLFIREYRSDRHEFANLRPKVHQVEFCFACQLPVEYSPANGSSPDSGQVEVLWVGLSELTQAGLYPKVLRQILPQLGTQPPPVYLGDVN